MGTSVCTGYEKIELGESFGIGKLFVGGQMRAGVAQHYHFRAVIRGFLTGRSAKIK